MIVDKVSLVNSTPHRVGVVGGSSINSQFIWLPRTQTKVSSQKRQLNWFTLTALPIIAIMSLLFTLFNVHRGRF